MVQRKWETSVYPWLKLLDFYSTQIAVEAVHIYKVQHLTVKSPRTAHYWKHVIHCLYHRINTPESRETQMYNHMHRSLRNLRKSTVLTVSHASCYGMGQYLLQDISVFILPDWQIVSVSLIENDTSSFSEWGRLDPTNKPPARKASRNKTISWK